MPTPANTPAATPPPDAPLSPYEIERKKRADAYEAEKKKHEDELAAIKRLEQTFTELTAVAKKYKYDSLGDFIDKNKAYQIEQTRKGKGRVSPELLAKMKAMHAEGINLTQISKKTGVGYQSVLKYSKQKWKK